MKTRFAVLFAACIAMPAFAHDPAEHKPDAANAPDCAQMQHMDMSKMNPKDPVMQAMHDKCMAAMKHDRDESGQAPAAAKDDAKTDKSAAHSHDDHGSNK